MTKPNNHLVISALGQDRPGIVDDFSRIIHELGCNISESRMAKLGEEFAILLMVEGPWNQLAKLENQVDELEKRLEMTIITRQTETKEDGMRPLRPYHALLLVGALLVPLAGTGAQEEENYPEPGAFTIDWERQVVIVHSLGAPNTDFPRPA